MAIKVCGGVLPGEINAMRFIVLLEAAFHPDEASFTKSE
jgi:hypothetical protein